MLPVLKKSNDELKKSAAIKMNEIDKYYQILGLKPGASEKEIVEAYKLLVKVWHPDRFSDEPNIQKNVTAKIKEIDEAFKQLLVWSDSIRAKRRETTEPKLEVRTEPSEAKGGIVIQSEPEDAVIVINEQPVGMGCYERRDLPIGSYKVWVIKEGYENWEKDVCVKAGAKQEVLAKLKLKETPQSRATHLMEAEAQIAADGEEKEARTCCSQCGTENSSEAKFCQKCGKPLGQSERSTPLEASEAGAIWNPNAAASWSLPFTPAFGSYLQMLNWRTLGEPAKASSAQSWFYASLVMQFINFLMWISMGDPKVAAMAIWWVSFLYLIIWYFAANRPQAKYVKAKFGTNYPKRPWGQALLIAVGCWVVAFALGFIFRAVTTEDNIHTASVIPSSPQTEGPGSTQLESLIPNTTSISANPTATVGEPQEEAETQSVQGSSINELGGVDGIKDLLEKIRQANLQNNIDLFMSCYASDFKDREGKRRATLESWEKFNYLDMSYDLKQWSISLDTAEARVGWLMRISPKSGGQPRESKTVLDVPFKKEEDSWKIKALN